MTDAPNVLIAGLPEVAYVGQYEFALAAPAPGVYPELVESDGVTHFESDRRRILVSRALPFKRFVNVLLHELIHAIHWDRGVIDGDLEETVTAHQADGLTDFWIDNPKLADWFARAYHTLRVQRRE